MKHRPPSHDTWLLDSFVPADHEPDECLAYRTDSAGSAGGQLRARSAPAWMISPVTSGWRGRLRGIFSSE